MRSSHRGAGTPAHPGAEGRTDGGVWRGGTTTTVPGPPPPETRHPQPPRGHGRPCRRGRGGQRQGAGAGGQGQGRSRRAAGQWERKGQSGSPARRDRGCQVWSESWTPQMLPVERLGIRGRVVRGGHLAGCQVHVRWGPRVQGCGLHLASRYQRGWGVGSALAAMGVAVGSGQWQQTRGREWPHLGSELAAMGVSAGSGQWQQTRGRQWPHLGSAGAQGRCWHLRGFQ